MPAGHPEGLPDFFLDRSLGRIQVPTALKAAGLRVRTLAEEYGMPQDETISDTEWLAHAGRNGWPVLMKDERIRYRPAEKDAVIAFNVQAFCLTSGNLRGQAMAEQFLTNLEGIALACLEAGPLLYVISQGGLRRIDL